MTKNIIIENIKLHVNTKIIFFQTLMGFQQESQCLFPFLMYLRYIQTLSHLINSDFVTMFKQANTLSQVATM